MKARIFTTVVTGFILSGMFMTFIYTPQVKADHCHPTNNNSHMTNPAPAKSLSAPVTNSRRQRNNPRIRSINYKPPKSTISSVNNNSESSDVVSIEDIYSKDFPLAISSIDLASRPFSPAKSKLSSQS